MTSFSVASSLPVIAAPFGNAQPSQSTADASFSSHFESAASSSESNHGDTSTTEPKTDRSKSTEARSNPKPERPKAAGNSAAALLGTPAQYQQILDDRKLQLSLDRSTAQNQSATDPSQKNIGALSAMPEVAKSATTANTNIAAQNKGGVAFGANLHMDSTHLSQNATHTGTQAIADTKNSGARNHKQESGGAQDESPKKDLVAHATNNISSAAVAHAATSAQQAAPVAALDHHATAAYTANATSKPIAAAPVATAAPVLEAPVSTLSNKSIDFQVSAADDNAVSVRVTQRAGDVQVTVRTPDTDLAQSLRQNLPELSDRLAQSGVRGDLWQPSTSSATNDQSSDSNGGNQSQAGQNAYSDAQSNQKQQDKNQSAWLNQMYEAESPK